MYFNSTKVQKSTKKVVEEIGEAQNKGFFSLFFRSKRTTQLIGYSGQTLSGITEFLAVWTATDSQLPLFQWSNLLGVSLGLFAVLLFEVIGIRVYLVKVVRQKVNKDFNTWESKALFRFNIAFLAVLLLANIGASVIGQQTTFTKAKNIDVTNQTYSLDSTAQNQINNIQSKYHSKDSLLTAKAETDKQTIITNYDATIKGLNNTRWAIGKAKGKDHRSYLDMNDKITNTDAEKLNKLSAIDTTLNGKLARNETLMNDEITIIRASTSERKTGIKTSAATTINIYGLIETYTLPLLIILILLSVAAIIYEEIFFSGAKQQIEAKEVMKKPNLLVALIKGLYGKLYHFCFVWVVRIVGKQAFDYNNIEQEKELFNVDKVQPFKIGKVSFNPLKWFSKEEPQPVINTEIRVPTIGFKTKNNLPQNNSQSIVTQQEKQKQVLAKYKPTTVIMWYKRSNLIKQSLSKKTTTKQNNTDKYLLAKEAYLKAGYQVIEKSNTVEFIF